MYIHRLRVENFRTFKNIDIEFVHPDLKEGVDGTPRPRLPNVNLILGNNGAGKTSLLKCVAMAALGPAVSDANLPIYRLIRREGTSFNPDAQAQIKAEFWPHRQDRVPGSGVIESTIRIVRPGGSDELERAEWAHRDDKRWHPIYKSDNDAFFFVGYGASRRVESRDHYDEGSRQKSFFRRAQRVRSLFEESYSLVPLSAWLPAYASENPGRFTQFKNLMNALLAKTGYRFSGQLDGREYLFAKGSSSVPFPALSDGYRAYIGWVGDLLYHVCETCPSGKKLVDNQGIVMVDEVDLHLHPKWQMTVLPTLSKTLPKIQFIVTSHSPLVVGSLEWMNIILMDLGRQNQTKASRLDSAVHGLDADQILLTDFFGLETTRADSKARRLKSLSIQAIGGDDDAAEQLLKEMSRGSEAMREGA